MDHMTKTVIVNALIAAAVCYGGYQYFFKPEPPATLPKTTQTAQSASSDKKPAASSGTTKKASSDDATKKAEEKKKLNQNPDIHFKYYFFEVKNVDSIGSLKGPFLSIKMRLIGKDSTFIVDSEDIRLVDTDRNLYRPDEAAMIAYEKQDIETFRWKKIEPGVPTIAYMVFRCPAGTKVKSVRFYPNGVKNGRYTYAEYQSQ